MSWTSMTLIGQTDSAEIIGLSGSGTDLWALQNTGGLFHSTGGAFQYQFSLNGGVKGLYAAGGKVVVVQNREIRLCSANCSDRAAYSSIDLTPLGLFGEVACGKDAAAFAIVVTNINGAAGLFEWTGTGLALTNRNLGIQLPRQCWYDRAGSLNIAGEDKVVVYDGATATPQPITSNGTDFYGGCDVEGTSWAVGESGTVAWRNGGSWTRLSASTTGSLYAVGGLRRNEVFAFGRYQFGMGNGYLWNGSALVPTGDILPNTGVNSVIREMLTTAANELWVAGGNAYGPIILRGRR